MNKKLAKLAKKLHDDFNDNLQDIFTELMKVLMDNREYFSQLSAEDTIKLVYYIYSLNKTGTFDLGEKIISELHLAQFFDYSKNNPHMEQCDYCDGDGKQDCSECDGMGQVRCPDCDEGQVECNDCDGDGEIKCTECDGSGEIDGEECEECNGGGEIKCVECGGRGEFTCSSCGGEGYEQCSECSGNGNQECEYCEGEGETETAEYDYQIKEWLIFDSQLISYLYKESADSAPIGKTLEFTNRPTVLLINSRKEHGQFDDLIEENYIYCFKISPFGSDKLYFDNHSKTPTPFKYSTPILGVSTWDEPDTLLRD